MPAHDIDVTIPAQTVKNKDMDMEVVVRADGHVFGRVRISKGSIDWVPANSDHPRRMSWERFAEVMDERGRIIKPR